ncbi:hypothetical protein RchiOBHm_Chr3g0471241 [Rosa chinensis]|uniref:Uncharacterized protein n=1 Tax=Rosa chinensis TaxID=74649 RepID=A0A2P6RB89_ROSCH|nr:uncharacterized protein LOC112192806 isoform X1 [Rosa chinensis]PRQ43698.1 hypothetical protein RchiOBHm_Chr3g0471241 [Rosa chinensis]
MKTSKAQQRNKLGRYSGSPSLLYLCSLIDQGTEARLVSLVLAICQCLDWDNSSNGIVLLWPPRHHSYIYKFVFIYIIVTYIIMDGDLVCPEKMGRSVEVGV